MRSSWSLYSVLIRGEIYKNERIDLYRDDDLGCFKNASGPQAERIKKAFNKLFKNEFKLNTVSETNLKVVNLVNLTLNLSSGKYIPYNKPDNKPLYINENSNHPPNIIQNLPESISRRANKLSSGKTVFNNSKVLFNNSLSNSGFGHKIKFQSLTENKIATVREIEDERLYGSTSHTAVM